MESSGQALLANTIAARDRPVDTMGIMAKAVESAVIVDCNDILIEFS
jgi:hypothetical protein